MRALEIIRDIDKQRDTGKRFIKWWRIENDFTDYETFDSFIAHARSSQEIGGYELLDIDEMWDVLKRWKPTGLRRVYSTKGEHIEWQRRATDGTLRTEICPLTPESMIAIFDYETGGDVVG